MRRDQYAHQLLAAIEADQHLSQRSLARSLGIALGLTNLLLRRLVRKGWVRMIHIRPNRVRYLLTPAGIAEKARLSRDSLQYSVRFYVDARNRMRDQFAKLQSDGRGGRRRSRIVFLGAGEVAEIGYVCLQETELQLIGVIGDTCRPHFFNVPIYPLAELRQQQLGGEPFDWLLVMLFDDRERTVATLSAADVPLDRVHWL